MERDLSNAILASPNQANKLFRLDGNHPINIKNLFVVRFLKRATNDSTLNDLCFLAKSVERPTVQPTVEEINQYNKKRLVQTGLKYNPISCTLYDTADGLVQRMWVDYSSYYFGDYRQTTQSFRDDMLDESMIGDREGYGVQIRSVTSSEPSGINSQYYFEGLEVYHVWGGEFTSYRLLNPKIASYTPDELDYEQNAASMITLSLHYEGIHHENQGNPMSIARGNTTSAAFLRSVFGSQFSGNTPDPDSGSLVRRNSFTSVPYVGSTTPTVLTKPSALPVMAETTVPESSIGGAISRYGEYNFGSLITTNYETVEDLSNTTSAILGLPTIATYIGEVPDVLPTPSPDSAQINAQHRDRNAIRLSNDILATLNNRSDGTSQIGFRAPVVKRTLRVGSPKKVIIPTSINGTIQNTILVSSEISGSANELFPQDPEG